MKDTDQRHLVVERAGKKRIDVLRFSSMIFVGWCFRFEATSGSGPRNVTGDIDKPDVNAAAI